MSHRTLRAYVCPICSARVSAKPRTVLWCQCLPATPTRMDDEVMTRQIMQAIGATTFPFRTK